MGNSQHTQNIQINKIIGKNEECLLFYGKTKHAFWPTQYLWASVVGCPYVVHGPSGTVLWDSMGSVRLLPSVDVCDGNR